MHSKKRGIKGVSSKKGLKLLERQKYACAHASLLFNVLFAYCIDVNQLKIVSGQYLIS